MYKNILLLATTNVPNESELENVKTKSHPLNVLQITYSSDHKYLTNK